RVKCATASITRASKISSPMRSAWLPSTRRSASRRWQRSRALPTAAEGDLHEGRAIAQVAVDRTEGEPGNPLVDSSAAALTPYELRNLIAHLEAARRHESVHRLLALEESRGINLWFQIKYMQGELGGY